MIYADPDLLDTIAFEEKILMHFATADCIIKLVFRPRPTLTHWWVVLKNGGNDVAYRSAEDAVSALCKEYPRYISNPTDKPK